MAIPIENYYGSGDVRDPGGVNSEIGDKDPTAVPRHQFLQRINCRVRGNVLEPRGGQKKVNAAALATGARIYAVNLELGAPLKLWVIGVGCPEISAATGVHLGYFDPEQCPRLQRVVYYSTAVAPSAIGTFGGVPHVVVDSQLRRVQLGKVAWGTEAIALAGATQDLPLANLTAGYKCNAMAEFDGKLFLALDDGGANGKIMSWDGVTLRDDLTGIAPVKALGLFRDTLVAGFAAAANHIRTRVKGASPGTWTTVAPGAGTVSTFPGNNSIASFKDVLYGASGSTTIWSYDGTTLTSNARTIAGALIEALVQEFGLLIYGYKSSTPAAILGKFDGVATWTDVVKDLTAQLATALNVRGLTRYRGAIVAALTPTGSPLRIAISPLSDIAGTYELVAFPGALVGDAKYLETI